MFILSGDSFCSVTANIDMSIAKLYNDKTVPERDVINSLTVDITALTPSDDKAHRNATPEITPSDDGGGGANPRFCIRAITPKLCASSQVCLDENAFG
jgi:hypothetical protein